MTGEWTEVGFAWLDFGGALMAALARLVDRLIECWRRLLGMEGG